jgi:hypothetical protein
MPCPLRISCISDACIPPLPFAAPHAPMRAPPCRAFCAASPPPSALTRRPLPGTTGFGPGAAPCGCGCPYAVVPGGLGWVTNGALVGFCSATTVTHEHGACQSNKAHSPGAVHQFVYAHTECIWAFERRKRGAGLARSNGTQGHTCAPRYSPSFSGFAGGTSLPAPPADMVGGVAAYPTIVTMHEVGANMPAMQGRRLM